MTRIFSLLSNEQQSIAAEELFKLFIYFAPTPSQSKDFYTSLSLSYKSEPYQLQYTKIHSSGCVTILRQVRLGRP